MSLDLKRKEVELMRVQTAKAELLLKIAEREDDITRLQASIKISQDTEQKLLQEIKALKGE